MFFFSKPQKNIFLYNTLTRKKELFKPIKRGKVGLYTCGPTVYGFPHLGNLRAYLFEDILKRVLEYNNLKVKHVMNITDVGHLTNDRDLGEDKMEKEAEKEGKTAWEIADFYTNVFKNDLKKLNIIFPDIFCKATDNIKEQINLIKKLEEKGFTYKTSDGIYFDTSKVSDYTKLSHQNIEDLQEGARVEANPEKKNPTDFALWKFSPKDFKRQMEWESPYGVGFPGWHLECSAMSLKYLGEHFDIHCGGIDHIDVHHTNEIAQTESATGKKPWVNVWMHGAFLNMSGDRKMSKSSGDLVTVNTEFIDKKIDPLAYRFSNLSVHYRKPTEWNEDVKISAKNGLDNLHTKILNLGNNIGKVNNEWKNKFYDAINDDLNMPQAMALLNEILRSDIPKEDKLATIYDFDKVLGLNLQNKSESPTIIPEEIIKIAEERKLVRGAKDWKKSDELRDKILSLGYEIKDTSSGYEISKN
ncbi:MAG: cysteine--tRNA ligase [Minisyncoccia bacterium]